MPKPKNKAELLQAGEHQFTKLLSLIDRYPEEEQHEDFPPGSLNRNIRDVLAHLHQWHLMMLDWYEVGMSGAQPDMPAKGYTWKTTAALNQHIRDSWSRVKLVAVRRLLGQSYLSVRALIEAHTDEELFTRKKYHWTGSTSLGAYLISATSSHYHWAHTFIRKSKKATQSKPA